VGQVRLGDQPTRELCQALGEQFSARSEMSRIWQVAAARELPFSRVPPMVPRHDRAPLHVSVAYDEAFHCYFPDTLDVLELRGADVSDFSPLRDERLPAGTDIVYFGCGHPERFARELADNDCMIAALRDHLCMGKRIYAEGAAAAYLCQRLITLDGEEFPMVGVFNAVAHMNPHATEPKPVEIVLAEANWLGSAGTVVRGYLNDAWTLEATGPLRQFVDSDSSQLDLIGQHQAIGSRLHLNFAAQPEVLNRFFESHAPSLDLHQPAVR
jgi:cobyrinic acid a,c-diamide synthase